MTTSPSSPRWLRGAIVAIDLANQGKAPTTVVLQYNPEELTRTLAPRMVKRDQRGRAQALGFSGAPDETFTVKTKISAGFDVADAPVRADASTGVLPLLAALEVLLYPRSDQVRSNERLLEDGQIEIGGGVYDAPLTLFVWGANRALPVEISGLDITEIYFDPNLNPTHAEVTIRMKALSYSDLDPSHKGYNLFLTYQKGKEQLAARGVASDPAAYLGFDPSRYG